MSKKLSRLASQGFSMIELLVVLAIVAILMLVLYVSLQSQLIKSYDAERKSDLETIKVAFEDYFNDNGCYPDADALNSCRGTVLQPYLKSIPCDPITKQPYKYIPLAADQCKGYQLYASLDNPNDPVIERLDCDGVCGCGLGSEYNYGVSAGVGVKRDTCEPLPSPTPVSSPSPVVSPTPIATPPAQNGGATPGPTPTPDPTAAPQPTGEPRYEYACAPGGQCNQYNLNESNCEYTFASSAACDAACAANEALYKCN